MVNVNLAFWILVGKVVSKTQPETPQSPVASTSSTSTPGQLQSPVPSSSKTLTPGQLEEFAVNWDKIPTSMMNTLKLRARLPTSDSNKFVRLVMDQVFTLCARPNRPELATVAKDIVGKYPDSFIDKIGETVVGTGYDSLLQKLLNRRDNQLRDGAMMNLK